MDNQSPNLDLMGVSARRGDVKVRVLSKKWAEKSRHVENGVSTGSGGGENGAKNKGGESFVREGRGRSKGKGRDIEGRRRGAIW